MLISLNLTVMIWMPFQFIQYHLQLYHSMGEPGWRASWKLLFLEWILSWPHQPQTPNIIFELDLSPINHSSNTWFIFTVHMVPLINFGFCFLQDELHTKLPCCFQAITKVITDYFSLSPNWGLSVPRKNGKFRLASVCYTFILLTIFF